MKYLKVSIFLSFPPSIGDGENNTFDKENRQNIQYKMVYKQIQKKKFGREMGSSLNQPECTLQSEKQGKIKVLISLKSLTILNLNGFCFAAVEKIQFFLISCFLRFFLKQP